MATVLIVDDEHLNRQLLCATLDGLGHTLIEAASGEEALAAAGRQTPDLVLLDVRMPGIDGYETTRRLKHMAGEELVPVVLITSLTDHEARVQGLGAGADDFLSKPLDRHELLLRVRNLLALRARSVALARRNLELAELHRFKDEMSLLLVHDLKNPMTVVLSNLEFLVDEERSLQPEAQEALHDARSASRRVMRLLANLVDTARVEGSRLELRRTRVDVSGLVTRVVGDRALLARTRGLTLTWIVDDAAGVELAVDVDLVTRVIENLLDNSFRHTPRSGRITISAVLDPGRRHLDLRVGNSGASIPPVLREHIFEKFGQASDKAGRLNLGLGLYFCRLAAEAHGGRLWVEETPELPTVFVLRLPLGAGAAALEEAPAGRAGPR